MKDAFGSYHPLVNFTYFALVLVFSMIFMHPVCLAVSLASALTYGIYLNRKKAVKFNLLFMLPMLLLTALLNPLFNHEGMTILTYFKNGNPLTQESINYGIAAAVMLITVVGWFSCFNSVITSDKFVYLFGRMIPALSLILAMALRMVPRFKAQAKIISNAQKCVGRDISNGSLLLRARHGLRIISILITWALENAIETADSMKSRGYGLRGRTAFSIYKFTRRDAAALLYLLACGGYIVAGSLLGGLKFRYFPTTRGAFTGAYTYSLFAVYFALCIMPIIINFKEDRKWKAIKSRI